MISIDIPIRFGLDRLTYYSLVLEFSKNEVK